MPYSNLPAHAFWKLCREDPGFRLSEIWAPKFAIDASEPVATAGSCFAQNIQRYLKRSSLSPLQAEPAPRGMNAEVARRFGYDLYTARYGNIYTARQLRQLIEDAVAQRVHDSAIWERDGRFFDALRPGVEPEGLGSAEETRAHRMDHLGRVAWMLREMKVFVFTLGLTEAWQDIATGQVFPTAPGVVAGTLDPDRHGFVNFGFADCLSDMRAVLDALREIRPDLKVILTVSPVPLTATASGGHVLAATTYSKSVLRAVAGELAASDPLTDYFPSFEIVSGLPFGARSYDSNLRTVNEAAVDRVMEIFFSALGAELSEAGGAEAQDEEPSAAPGRRGRARRARREAEICEEAMLEAFARK